MRERRRHKRVYKAFVTKFRESQKEDELPSGNWEVVLLRDLSAGGLSFLFDKDIDVGSQLDFDISLPGKERMSLKCRGEVLRNDNYKGAVINKIAAMFTDIAGEDAGYINDLAF